MYRRSYNNFVYSCGCNGQAVGRAGFTDELFDIAAKDDSIQLVDLDRLYYGV
jgi:hypothetical protein